MRQKPILTYNGLTVVLSNPSRFDRVKLLSANGGVFFNNECLQPETNIMQCDVRLKEDRSPLLSGTKCVLVLGESAAETWITREHTLGQIRGTPYVIGGIPHIASFFPQDAVDPRDFESSSRGEEMETDDTDALDDKSHHGRTARKNYRFWLTRDVKRCINICTNGLPATTKADYEIHPNFDRIAAFLRETKDTDLFFDIETDTDLHITCFAIATADSPVFVVPLLTHNYTRAYNQTEDLLRSLAVAIRRNTLVAHNGAAFDFLVLPLRYGIPVGPRLYDTMMAHHRFWPLVEKSLGHCTSLWTYEPFHKDESDFSYNTPESCYRLWSYCGKDVHTMRLIKQAIGVAARRIPGMERSISEAMDSIRPYITIMLQGMYYREDKLRAIVRENDRLMTHYASWVPKLIGSEALGYVKGTGKSCMLGSTDQCVRYFHDLMGYPVVMRSPKTGEPSMGKRAIYKLRLKHKNPLLDLCIAYRETQKESGSLKFNPFVSAAGGLFSTTKPSSCWPRVCQDRDPSALELNFADPVLPELLSTT